MSDTTRVFKALDTLADARAIAWYAYKMAGRARAPWIVIDGDDGVAHPRWFDLAFESNRLLNIHFTLGAAHQELLSS